MIHPLHQQIAVTLDRHLRERRIVVFYDLRKEFEAFLDELEVVGLGGGELPRVCIHDTMTAVARFDGSFFALKAAVEPILGAERPEALLVYVPGHAKERLGKLRGPASTNAQGLDVWNVLFELDCAGKSYEPSLRGLARTELRRRYTDGDIDEMLAPDSLTYHDVVRFLLQADAEGGGQASLLKLVLGSGGSEELLCRWLVDETRDAELQSKQAGPELLKLVQARLGLGLAPDVDLAKARHQTLRYVLVNEFRSDLDGAPPERLAVVAAPPTQDEMQRVRDMAERLRRDPAEVYPGIADGIERELDLSGLGVPADRLGRIDTFRFEEVVLLEHAATLVADGKFERALELVLARRRSFWVDRNLGRLGQWETCRLTAELGREVARIRPLLKSVAGTPAAWIESYGSDWYRADLAQRALESWVAKLEEEPEQALERAVGLVRRQHETLLKEMTQGFTASLASTGWSVNGVLHQTRIYPELVEPLRGRVGYFFVDAMRFEMAADLVEQLDGAEELRLVPATGALPSITPIGMAALLPGASSSFSVVDHKGKQLAARIGDTVMPGLSERMKYLKAVRPDAVDVDLGELLQKSTRALEKRLGAAQLVIVRSQSIDGLGEMDGGLLARQIMDTVIGNLARAVRKLARIGVEHFVITADHGHQFSIRKEEDMLMDKPGGETVDQHRRCWAGRGGQTPAAALRVSGAELGYDTDLDFIFPKGLAVFRAGGDLAFHHGGPSLQEMVVPVVTLRIQPAKTEAVPGSKVTLDGLPSVLTNRTFGMKVTVAADLFSALVPVRLVLVEAGVEVGRCGMAVDADLDRASGVLMVQPGKPTSVAMVLSRDEAKRVRIVAQDPATDALLAQSDEIDVKLGI